jgi:aryl-alcohol dehydrogenase-like predicted oxidoreductase
MEFERLGKSELIVSKIGLGAWQFGDKNWGWGESYGEKEALDVIDAALDSGINFIDTAEVYGNGISETIIGKAIKGRRDRVIIATKVSGQHLRYDDLLKAADESLKRLQVDYIDLYQIHWPSSYVPIEETMKAMEKLIDEGKIRYMGLSNFPVPLIREVERYFPYPVVSNQVRYNLVERDIEKEILPYCREKSISIIAWSPLAKGLLTGKYSKDSFPKDDMRTKYDRLFTREENFSQIIEFVEILKNIAKKYGKTPAQIALNWLISQPGIFAIPGAKRVEQVVENAGASGWRIEGEDIEKLNSSSSIKLSYF